MDYVEETIEIEPHNADGPPEDLQEFAAWARKLQDKVPARSLGSARITIESIDTYGGYCVYIFITYRRPKTEQEINNESRVAALKADRKRERDRAQYEKLKRQFE